MSETGPEIDELEAGQFSNSIQPIETPAPRRWRRGAEASNVVQEPKLPGIKRGEKRPEPEEIPGRVLRPGKITNENSQGRILR